MGSGDGRGEALEAAPGAGRTWNRGAELASKDERAVAAACRACAAAASAVCRRARSYTSKKKI